MLTRERFEQHVVKVQGGCWIWAGAIDSTGYGAIKVEGRKRSAHRVAFGLFKGEVPDGAVVRHTCNNPWCVCPDHLVIGTHRDNMLDFLATGVMREHGVKLECSDVEEIRARYASGEWTQQEIAQEYGITRSHVSDVISGKCWAK